MKLKGSRRFYINSGIFIALFVVAISAYYFFTGDNFKADFSMLVAEKGPNISSLEKANGMRKLSRDEIAIINYGEHVTDSSGITRRATTKSGYNIPSSMITSNHFGIIDGLEQQTYVREDKTTQVVNKSSLQRATEFSPSSLRPDLSSKIDPGVAEVIGGEKVEVIIKLKQTEATIFDPQNTVSENKTKLIQFQKIRSNVATLIKDHGQIEEDLPIVNGFSASVDKEAIDKLANDSRIQSIEKNDLLEVSLDKSAPIIGADRVWQTVDENNYSVTGRGINIAVIDTGVDYTHPDLGGCLGVGCKVIGGYDFVNMDDDPIDDNGHGTHVAATAAGKGLLWGIAPDANIIAYKVLDHDGMGYESSVITAIQSALDPNMDGDTSDRVDVISMSLGGPGNPDDSISAAVNAATELGVISVVAAGNSGPDQSTIDSPGGARSAITVAAACSDEQIQSGSPYCQGKIANFSSRGPVIHNGVNMQKPDVSAPGVSICAARFGNAFEGEGETCLDSRHIRISGTSMATPHVAGLVALLKQVHPELSPEAVKEQIKSTSKTLGLSYDLQGNGIVSGPEAVGILSEINFSPIILKITGNPALSTEQVTKSITISSKASSLTTYSIDLTSPENAPGISLSASKSQVSIGNGTTDSVGVTTAFDNTRTPPGIYNASLNLKDGDNLISRYNFKIEVLPSITFEPAMLDFGNNYPEETSWTSIMKTIKISNLRADTGQTVFIESDLSSSLKLKTRLVGGANEQESFEIPAGGNIILEMRLYAAQNNLLEIGNYSENITIKQGDYPANISVQFTKYYQLMIENADQDHEVMATVLDQTSEARFMTLLNPGNNTFLTDKKGPFDVALDAVDNAYSTSTILVDIIEDVFLVKDHTITVNFSTNSKNLISLKTVDKDGESKKLISCNFEIATKESYLPLINTYLMGMNPLDMTETKISDLSSNYEFTRFCNGEIQPSPESYLFYNKISDGINRNITQENKPEDFKKITQRVENLNLPTGTKVKSFIYGWFGVSSMDPKLDMILPLEQTIYSNIPPQKIFGLVSQFVGLSSSCSNKNIDDCDWLYNSRYVDVAKAEIIRDWWIDIKTSPKNGNVFYFLPTYLTADPLPVTNRVVAGGVGPYGWAGKFQNFVGGEITLDTVSSHMPPFYQQHFGTLNYPGMPWTLKKNGALAASGNLPEMKASPYMPPTLWLRKPVELKNMPVGLYEFETSLNYLIDSKYAQANVVARFDTTKADKNPPALNYLFLESSGTKIDKYSATVNNPNQIIFSLDPVGGNLGKVSGAYRIDNETIEKPLDIVLDGNDHKIVLPIVPAKTKFEVILEVADDSDNLLKYSFSLPVAENRALSDLVPPLTAIIEPFNGSFATGKTKIVASASDNNSISRVEFYAGKTLIGEAIRAPYEIIWDTAKYQDGNYQLFAKAYDGESNAADSGKINIFIDSTAPTTMILTPSGKFIKQSSTIEVKANDSVGVAKVELYKDGNLTQTAVNPARGDIFLFNLRSEDHPAGQYTYTAKAFDKINNTTTSESILVYGGTKPFAQVTQPVANSIQMGTIQIEADAFDDEKISSVQYYIDGRLVSTKKAAPYRISISSLKYKVGRHQVFVKAYDNRKNQTVSEKISFEVKRDREKPNVGIQTLPTELNLKGTTKIKIDASDNVKLQKVNLYVYQKRFGFKVNRRLVGTRYSSPYDVKFNAGKLKAGTYYLEARAADWMGNTKISPEIEFVKQ